MRTTTTLSIVLLILSSVAVAQGPALHYRFNENGAGNPINQGSYNPGSSVMIGLQTTGESADGTTCLQGVGGSGNLLHTGYYMNGGNAAWTVGFAVNTEANDGTFQYFLGDGSFRMFVTGDNQMAVRGGIPSINIPGAAGRYGWSHVVVSYDPTTLNLLAYVDGEQVMAVTAGPLTFANTVPLKIGGSSASAASIGAGTLMEDFRLYERTLSETEIRRWAGEAAALPRFEKMMITEVYVGEPDALELTNFSDSTLYTGGWTVAWRSGTGGVVTSQPLDIYIAAGETVVIKEPGHIAGIVPGTSVFDRFSYLPGNVNGITVALQDETGQVVDEVRINSSVGNTNAGTLGGAFRGIAARNTFAVSLERNWRQDSNSGKDWTAETRHSLGAESLSAGVTGLTHLQTLPPVVLNEIAVSPDYIELYNRSNAPVQLSKWFLVCSAAQNQADVVIKPFPSDMVLPAFGYLVIGDAATAPSEMPAGATYVDLSAVTGGNIPFVNREFSCALYDSFGHLIDIVRTKDDQSLIAHNTPRAPGLPRAIIGTAPLDASGLIARNVLSEDQDRGSDWYTTSTSTFGAQNVGIDGVRGRTQALDVRIHTPGLGNGITIIMNAGLPSSGQPFGFFYSFGHDGGNGPILGLDVDAVVNYVELLNLGLFQGLNSSGAFRLDVPAGSLPSGLDIDTVFFTLTANGELENYTDVLTLDI